MTLQEIEDLKNKYLRMLEKANENKNSPLDSGEAYLGTIIEENYDEETFFKKYFRSFRCYLHKIQYFDIEDDYFAKEVEGISDNKFLELRLIFVARSFKKYV